MSRSHVRTVKKAAGKKKPRSIRLRIRKIEFEGSNLWFKDSKKLTPLIRVLEDKIPATEITFSSTRKKSVVLPGWTAVKESIQAGGAEVYELGLQADERTFKLVLGVTDVSLNFECETPIEQSSIKSEKEILGELMEEIHAAYCGKAPIGPSLAIVLHNVPYTRPRPPRDNPQWPPGAIMFGICKRFFESQDQESRTLFEKLSSLSLPAGIARRQSKDLLIIETKASDLEKLGEQRSVLEKWIGDSLELSVDEDFNEQGDERLIVFEKEKAGQLGFYDSTTRTLYKTAPELKNDELDKGTLKRLERILDLDELPDGREVRAKRIVFVGRPAALRWRPWVVERGGAVAYLGTDGELWEPAAE